MTLELDGLARREEDAFGRAARALAAELGALLGLAPGAPALVVGLGNRAITPDNIGPKAADQTMVTRHLVERVPEHFGSFRPVAALAAGVLGTTGMESGEVVRAVAEQIKPACVVAVDALASRSLRRVCRTIQLADTGITPGSGVGNARAALNAETLGVPVIAVGVPTVVDAATLTCDVLAEAGRGAEPRRPPGRGERPDRHPQGHRHPGARLGEGHRIRDQSGPSHRPDHRGRGALSQLTRAGRPVRHLDPKHIDGVHIGAAEHRRARRLAGDGTAIAENIHIGKGHMHGHGTELPRSVSKSKLSPPGGPGGSPAFPAGQ